MKPPARVQPLRPVVLFRRRRHLRSPLRQLARAALLADLGGKAALLAAALAGAAALASWAV